MEIIILGFLLTCLFCVGVCPKLYMICNTNPIKKNNYQIMEA